MALPTVAGSAGLYAIRNTRTGEYYVGSTQNLSRRWKVHRTELRTGRHRNGKLRASWQRDGERAFRFEVLAVLDTSELVSSENRLLQTVVMDPLCLNIATFSRRPMAGRKHTEETRSRISAGNRGRPKSAEHRRRIGESHRGRKLSPEHHEKAAAQCARMTAALTGKKQSAATIAKRVATFKQLYPNGPRNGASNSR